MPITYERGQDRRTKILEYITIYQKENGFAPSVTEIAEHIGTARSNIHHHLGVLRTEGLLTSHAHVARSWVVQR